MSLFQPPARRMSGDSPTGIASPFVREEVEGSLPERFARVVAAGPRRPAIAAGDVALTYEALDRRSDALAGAIARRAPGEAPVAVILSDPVSTVIGLLGTWKAARLCVPLDPALPGARLATILRDAEAGLIVTDRDGAALGPLSAARARQLRLDELDPGEPAGASAPGLTGDSLACLLYTSGSTGEPKGVLRSHRNLLHRARCSVASLGIRPEDRVSGLHSPAFAAGLRDMLAALLGGAALLPFDLRRAGLRALADWMGRERVSVVCAVVTTFRQLLASLDPGERFPSVRVVRLGSEPLHRRDVERLRERFSPDCLVVAGYGASEASGIVEYRIGADTPLPAGRVPAGYAHEGVEILVLDEDGHPVERGRAGEVAVRSRYLSLGYWRRPDLTRATFSADPADPAMRVYRTGDVGRLGPDGCLEVLGRRDHQAKVRGYLVHPGEVELALAEHPAVREAVVAGQEDRAGDVRLVAYVVPADRAGVSPPALRRFLRDRLPAYMVPAAIVPLEALPVTTSGKVDRAALPSPPEPAAARSAVFLRPDSPLEDHIARIWEDLFDVRPVGSSDDFFEMGGDSLLAAAFVTSLESACGLAVPPTVLLEASTVRGLAAALVRGSRDGVGPVTALRTSGSLPPLFFLHGDYNGGGFYCHALARSLHPDRPFYAVHPHGLDGSALPPSIEAMATDRLAAMRAVRPRGPYLLAGHCNGALVALELARQLEAQGEPVAATVLVEARAPARSLRALQRASDALGRLRGLTPAEQALLFARVEHVSEQVASWALRGRRRLADLARSGGQPRDLAQRLTRAARDLARAVSDGRRQNPVAPPLHGAHRRGRGLYHRAIRRYLPAPYAGRTILIRAEATSRRVSDLGWSSLLPRLETVVVPGDHITCVTRHVAAFAACLEQVLQDAGPFRPD